MRVHSSRGIAWWLRAALILLACLGGVAVSAAQAAATPAGTPIVNTAFVSYSNGGSGTVLTLQSNQVTTLTTAATESYTGRVFASSTGTMVNGATITIIDNATGKPAVVYGSDGKSIFPSTLTSGGTATDTSGKVYTFPQGGFTFPGLLPGTYHFEVKPPQGYLFPSTVDPASFGALSGGPFTIGDGSMGGNFRVVATPAAQDIPIDPLTASLVVTKQASKQSASIGDFVQYIIDIQNTQPSGSTDGLKLTDVLPLGLRYQAGSATLDGVKAADPAISANGRTLTFSLGSIAAGGHHELRYVVQVGAGTPDGNAINHVSASGNGGAVSNGAEALVLIHDVLMSNSLTIVGRVAAGECGTPQDGLKGIEGVRIYMEDGRYANSDQQGLFHFEGVRPGTHVVQLDLDTVPRGYEVVPCVRNSRFAGRSYSQFVDANAGALWRTDFYLRRLPLEPPPVPVRVVPLAGDDHAQPPPPAHDLSTPQQAQPPAIPAASAALVGDSTPRQLVDPAWWVGPPSVAWMLPQENSNPDAPVSNVAVRHFPGQKVKLYLNGRPVSRLNFDGQPRNPEHTMAVSVWRSVVLEEGDNNFVAEVVDAADKPVETLRRTVHYANVPYAAELVPEQSSLVADGVHRPVLAVRFLDQDGKPVRKAVGGKFLLDPPYTAAQEQDYQQRRALAGDDQFEPRFAVEGNDGVAHIELAPTTQTGEVLMHFHLARGRLQELRAWLQPELRDWIVVGFAEGTLAYKRLSGNMEALAEQGQDDKLQTDSQVSLFAKGRIKGDWLLTAAYDSAKERGQGVGNNLTQVIDPNQYYTLYGDGAQQLYDAASIRKLYLKLERSQFYAMFGDYTTGLTVSKLARYERTLNGVKSEYAGDRFRYSAFAAETDQAFQRDEILADGTSGLYYLSHRNVLINSDQVVLETRNRFRSDDIIDSKVLQRYIDYDIDYFGGTIYFRQPIPGRDFQFNPNYIVVSYETEPGTSQSLTAGGRGEVRLAGGRAVAGFSDIHEGQGTQDADLRALDFNVKLAAGLNLRLEGAQSGGSRATGGGAGTSADGSAYLAELEQRGSRFDGLLYLRQQGVNYGLSQLNGSETGTHKYGGLGAYNLGEHWNLAGEALHEDNLLSGAQREAGTALANYKLGKTLFTGGLQYAQDSYHQDGKADDRSEQVLFGAKRSFLDQRLDLEGRAEVSVGGQNDNTDYPTRMVLGVGYQLVDWAKVRLAQEFTDGALFRSNTTRFGVELAPWSGARLDSSINQNIGEYGPRTFGEMGLKQSLLLGKKWGVDFNVDRQQTVSGHTPPTTYNTNSPPASGSFGTYGGVGGYGQFSSGSFSNGSPASGFNANDDDYTAVSLGTTYRELQWSGNGRIEFRDGKQENKRGALIGFLREPQPGLALSTRLRIFDATQPAQDSHQLEADWQFSFARRPLRDDSRWTYLERLDLVFEQSTAPTSELRSRRIINNFNANRVGLDWILGERNNPYTQRSQLSFYYGSKYVLDRFDSQNYHGYTDMTGVEYRYDLTRRTDFGFQGSALHAWNAHNLTYSWGPSAGVSPFNNAWISIGYNFAGFRDSDFTQARYSSQGPYIKFRLKFDQDTRLGRDAKNARAVDWDDYTPSAYQPGARTP